MTHDDKLRMIGTRTILEQRFGYRWVEAFYHSALAELGGSLAGHAVKIGGDPMPDFAAAYLRGAKFCGDKVTQ